MGDILTIKDKILAFLKEKDIKKVDFFEAWNTIQQLQGKKYGITAWRRYDS